MIRVVSTAGTLSSIYTSYLALSHCWGRKEFLTLNPTNEKTFKVGMDQSQLAPNFRDAIHATRCLGFRYLWVDSLCILQGCREDWQREAPLMNKVYRNAVLTLAVADSADAYGGLFRKRNPALVVPYKTAVPLIDKETGKLTQREAYIDAGWSDWGEQVARATLNTRAWVLQERVLSLCTLYFVKTQLFWECKSLEASETFP